MTVTPIDRARPHEYSDELTTLGGFLDFLRATVVNKVAGLSEEDARRAAVSPSTLTPITIVKHLTAVECWWFSIDFANVELPEPPGMDFTLEPDYTLESVVAAYMAECARSRRSIADEPADAPSRGKDVAFNLRWALAHMIEETGRHCGHLDLLRESIDGQTGQ